MKFTEWDNLPKERKAEYKALAALRRAQAEDMRLFANMAMDDTVPESMRIQYAVLYVSAYRVVLTIDTWMRRGGP